ncbi:hypothetical protein CIK05_00775 [Bdellovibrio sp. qaytius]|nr:hypothetical protein CIK05_00775 [Bdellovibrio sp. qaytius]
MKKLILAVATLLVTSTSMAGTISICDTTVDAVIVRNIDGSMTGLEQTTKLAKANNQDVKICSVGGNVVAITKYAMSQFRPEELSVVAFIFTK